LAKVDRKH